MCLFGRLVGFSPPVSSVSLQAHCNQGFLIYPHLCLLSDNLLTYSTSICLKCFLFQLTCPQILRAVAFRASPERVHNAQACLFSWFVGFVGLLAGSFATCFFCFFADLLCLVTCSSTCISVCCQFQFPGLLKYLPPPPPPPTPYQKKKKKKK